MTGREPGDYDDRHLRCLDGPVHGPYVRAGDGNHMNVTGSLLMSLTRSMLLLALLSLLLPSPGAELPGAALASTSLPYKGGTLRPVAAPWPPVRREQKGV